MTTQKLRPSFADRLRAQRATAAPERAAVQKVAKGVEPPAPQGHAGAEALRGGVVLAKVPEKVAAEHGASLAAAARPLAAIHAAVDALEPWRAKAFDRVLETFYKLLGETLKAAPAGERAALAESSAAALSGLIERSKGDDHLSSAVSAVLAAVGSAMRLASRGRLDRAGVAEATSFVSAVDLVNAAIDELGSRPGLSRALNVFPNVAEQLEQIAAAKGPLSAAARRELWEEALAYVARTAPLGEITLETCAALSKAVTGAAGRDHATAKALLAAATKAFRAEHAVPHRDVLQQLAAEVDRPAKGTPERQIFDAVNAALEKTAKAHPAGPARIYEAIYNLRAEAERVLAAGAIGSWPSTAALIERFGPTEHAAPVLELALARRHDPAGPAIERAAHAKAPNEAARALAEVVILDAGVRLEDVPGVAAALAKLDRLPGSVAISTALALGGVLASPQKVGVAQVVESAIALAASGRKDDPIAALGDRANRQLLFLEALEAVNAGANVERRAVIALELARVAGDPCEGDAAAKAASMVASIERSFPGARVERLAADLWVLADPTVRWKEAPDLVLAKLTAALARARIDDRDAAEQEVLLDVAIRLAATVARMDGDPEIPLRRIALDLEAAAADPAKLALPPGRGAKPANALAARAQAQPSLAGFLAAIPDLPPELAISAGVHLGAERLAWVAEQSAAARGRDTRRALRDLVYACVTAQRLDFIDAARASAAPGKAISRAIAFVAKSYRDNRMGEVQFDRLIAGLAKGEDPIAEIDQERAAATLARLGLGDVKAGGADPAGIAMLSTCSPAVTALMGAIDRGRDWDGTAATALKPAFLEVLGSVAAGTWPATKYESDAGKATLAFLDDRRRALWREETVTALEEKGDPDQVAAQSRAVSLLRGLSRAIQQHVRLDVGWDRAALAGVEARYGAALAKAHEHAKGSPEHRAVSAELGQLRTKLALLRLVTGANAAKGDPKTILGAMKGVLEDATGPLRTVGLKAGAEIAREILREAQSIEKTPRAGVYAVDEDTLEASLMSASGGCCWYTGERGWTGITCAANANEKVLRVYDNGSFVYRAFFKVYEGEIGDYKGPILWMNEAKPHGNGSTQHRDLLFKHAILKAQAMGIPLVTMPITDGGGTTNDLSGVAAEMGLAEERKSITVHFPTNTATGWTYVDYWTGRDPDGKYTESATYRHNTRKAAAGAEHLTLSYNFRVVMPAQGDA